MKTTATNAHSTTNVFFAIQGSCAKELVNTKSHLHLIKGTSACDPQNNFGEVRFEMPQKGATQINNSYTVRKQTSDIYNPFFSLKSIFVYTLALIIFAISFCGIEANYRAHVYHTSVSNITKQTITVHAQDTLWDLASTHHIEGLSQQQTVDWIVATNNLSNTQLQPGMKLVVAMAS